MHTWTSLTSDGAARMLDYSFGVAKANTLAARQADGSWLVISPAMAMPDAAYDALAKDGPVTALIAPNGFHHMGQAAWRSRFPNAVSYAPAGSLARLAKKGGGVAYRPLSELRTGDGIQLIEPDGMKVPDLLASVRTADGNVFFAGDLISNTQAGDTKFPASLIFKLLGGGTGYRFNPVPGIVYLKDKKVWKASVKASVGQSRPVVIVPAHGAAVTADATTRTLAFL